MGAKVYAMIDNINHEWWISLIKLKPKKKIEPFVCHIIEA